jgi:hypothetical protein
MPSAFAGHRDVRAGPNDIGGGLGMKTARNGQAAMFRDSPTRWLKCAPQRVGLGTALGLAMLISAAGSHASTTSARTDRAFGHVSASVQEQRRELAAYVRFLAGTAKISHTVNSQNAALARNEKARPFNQLATYRTAVLLRHSTAAYLQAVQEEEPHGTGAVGELEDMELQFAQELHAAMSGFAQALRTGNNRLFTKSVRGATKAGHLGIRVGDTGRTLFESLGGNAAFVHLLSAKNLRQLEAAG